jgi:hypothetical protein
VWAAGIIILANQSRAVKFLHEPFRLPYLINQTPGEKLRHGAALLLSTTPANSWASQTSALTPAKSCKLLDQLNRTERNFSLRVWELMGALYMWNYCCLLGDNSSIITLYLNPFIISSYYKNTISRSSLISLSIVINNDVVAILVSRIFVGCIFIGRKNRQSQNSSVAILPHCTRLCSKLYTRLCSKLCTRLFSKLCTRLCSKLCSKLRTLYFSTSNCL